MPTESDEVEQAPQPAIDSILDLSTSPATLPCAETMTYSDLPQAIITERAGSHNTENPRDPQDPPNLRNISLPASERVLDIRSLYTDSNVEVSDAERFTSGREVYNRGNGQIKFFGPSANYHYLPDEDEGLISSKSLEALEYIRSIPPEIEEELLCCFWKHYNSVWPMVHRELFTLDKDRSGNKFYSPLLHLCILSIGYRYVDKTNPSFRSYSCGRYKSSFYIQARSVLGSELTIQSTIPSMQALLLISDLEGACQRYHSGWLHAGRLNQYQGRHLN